MAESKVDKALQQLFKRSVATKVLWSNASPASAFSAQTIKMALSGYDGVLIKHRISTSKGTVGYMYAGVGDNADMVYPDARNIISTVNAIIQRNVDVSTTGVTFSADSYRAGNNTSSGSNNKQLIPLDVIGVILSGGGTA